jgi:hypothetical protein
MLLLPFSASARIIDSSSFGKVDGKKYKTRAGGRMIAKGKGGAKRRI